MRALLHGCDPPLEAALRERELELVREGPADVLVTLGPLPVIARLEDLSAEQWTSRFTDWAREPFFAFQAWLRDMLRRGAAGRWVAVTTTLGALPFPGGSADGAAAVALQTLVRIAAIEYGPRRIRANVVASGWRARTLPAELDSDLAVADTPTGRLVTEEDLAAAVMWLLSDDAVQVNGEILRVDGGYTITRGSRPDPEKLRGSRPDPQRE